MAIQPLRLPPARLCAALLCALAGAAQASATYQWDPAEFQAGAGAPAPEVAVQSAVSVTDAHGVWNSAGVAPANSGLSASVAHASAQKCKCTLPPPPPPRPSVPEPGALALLAVGALGLLAGRRKTLRAQTRRLAQF